MISDGKEGKINKAVIEQERVKGTFDKRSRDVKFNVGDIVLRWDKIKKNQETMENLRRFGWVLI